MEQSDDNQELATRYLLGELTEEEREDVEERLFADAEFLDEVRAAERDLIDSYLRGELEGGRLMEFERRFLTSPERRSRVLFADALTKARARRRTWPGSAGGRRLWLLAAALAALALCAFLLWRATQGPTPAPPEIVEQPPSVPPVQEQPPTTPVEPPSGPEPRAAPRVATLVLAAGRTRGAGAKRLSVAPGVEAVRLFLELRADDYGSYRAVLRTMEGEQVRAWRDLNAQRGPSGSRRLLLQAPTSLFTSRGYLVVVSGITEAGEVEEVGDYYFEVVKQ